MKKRRSKQQWTEHLARAEREGKSLAQYARERGLSASSLYMARHSERRLGGAAGARRRPTAFVPVKVTPGVMSSASRVRASLPNGVVLELVLGSDDRAMLTEWVAAVSRAPCSD